MPMLNNVFIMTALLDGVTKISCIHSLAIRAKRICSVNLLPEEINEIKKFASRNSFLKSISTSLIFFFFSISIKLHLHTKTCTK